MKKFLPYFQQSSIAFLPIFFRRFITVFVLFISFFGLSKAQTYCIPIITNGSSDDHITKVVFAGINKSSQYTGGYSDYTDNYGNVLIGETYPLSVTIEEDNLNNIVVFIDWNQNGSFDVPNERYEVIYHTAQPGPHTINITVPDNAKPGTTRMRVMTSWKYEILNACNNIMYGEIEDYSLVINENNSSCPTPKNLSIDDIGRNAAKISWINPSEDSGLHYDYFLTLGNATPNETTIPTGTTSEPKVELSNLAMGHSYTFWVRSTCSADNFSSWTSIKFETKSPWEEKFTNMYDLPNGWDNGGSYWATGIPEQLKLTDGFMISNYFYGGSVQSITTPSIGPIEAGDELSFQYIFWDYNPPFNAPPAGNLEFRVNVSTDNGNTFTEIGHIINTDILGWNSYVADLSAFVGESIKVKIVGQHNGSYNSVYLGLDNFYVGPTQCPTILNPHIVSNSPQQVTIGWSTPNSPFDGMYEYYFSTSSATPAIHAVATGSTASNSVDIHDLEPGHTYYFWVRARCDEANNGTWSAMLTVETEFEINSPWLEEFSNNTKPTGWNITGWTIGTGANILGSQGAVIYRELYNQAVRWQGTFETANITNIQSGDELTFLYTTQKKSAAVPADANSGNITISISTDYGQTYTMVQTINNDGLPGWKKFSLPLDDYIGEKVKLKIHASFSSGNYYYAFDNFYIGPSENCEAPYDLSVSNITFNEAKITWYDIANSEGYEYYYSEVAQSPTSNTTPMGFTTSNFIELSNLEQGKLYNFWVRSICNEENKSAWSAPISFETRHLISIPWNESFYNVETPIGWNIENWSIKYNSILNELNGPFIYQNLYYNSPVKGRTFTTPILGPILDNHYLSFNYQLANYYSPHHAPANGSGNFEVYISTDLGNTFNLIEQVNNDGINGKKTFSYSLANFSGENIQIKIIGNYISGNYYLGFDDFKIDIYTPELTHTEGIIYVKADGTGSGESWENATSKLQDAIKLDGVHQVWVASGTYAAPMGGLEMKNNVAILGGFSTEGDPSLEDRNWALYPTILTGNHQDRVIANVFTDNDPLTPSAVLDGFIIENGLAVVNDKVSNRLGGGIYNHFASPTLTNLIIRGNSATTGGIGGGIYNDNNSAPIITNTLIINNLASIGGGIHNTQSSPILTNVTISGNIANSGGSAMANAASSHPNIRNSIIFDPNRQDESSSLIYNYENIYNAIPNIPTYSYSIIQGSGGSGNWKDSGGDIGVDGGNNWDLDPKFTNSSHGDYTLTSSSPAVNMGSNSFFDPGNDIDLSSIVRDLGGNERNYQNGIIDIGAYEIQEEILIPTPNEQGIIFVRPIENGNGTGNSWENAMSNLQRAINTSGVYQVWVAAGTYSAPDKGFQMKNNVEIYGGFPNSGNPSWEDRNWKQHETILSGSQTSTVVFNEFNENSPLTSGLLDGFTIINGFSNEYSGGIYNKYASPTLRNLIIKDNEGYDGGGIGNFDSSSPKIINVILYNNAANWGGGISNYVDSSPEVINTLISNNEAYYAGGAISNYENSHAKLTNVTISGNFSGNINGIFDDDNSSSLIHNSIIWGNGSSNYVGNLQVQSSHNIIQGNENHAGNKDPKFINTSDVLQANFLKLAAGSPAINAGNNQVYLDALDDLNSDKDLAGNLRFIGGKIDLGAYESSFQDAVSLNGVVELTVPFATQWTSIKLPDEYSVSLTLSNETEIPANIDPNTNNWIFISGGEETEYNAMKSGTYTFHAPLLLPEDDSDSYYTNSTGLMAEIQITVQSGKIDGVVFDNKSFVYNGKIQSLEIDPENLPEGVTVEFENNGRKYVGTQTVTAKLTGENYEDLILTAELTITKAPLTVYAEEHSKVYGSEDPDLSFNVDEEMLQGEDDASVVSGSLTREGGEHVGTYEILGDNLTADNYEINFVSADFTITKAPLTVTADAQTKVYGQGDPELTFTVNPSELVNDDDASVVSGSLNRENGENVGTYEILGENLTADNYEINFVSADFTITKAPLTVTADAQTKVYGQSDPELTFTVNPSELVNGDDATVVSGSLTRESGENVGVYQIQGDNLTAENYEINFVSADFTITKAALTVTADAKTKVYGQADPALTYTVEAAELVNGDDASVVTGTLTRESGENVGVYQIQGENLTAENYEINFVSANFTITKAPLTVTADAKTKVYGQADPALTYSVDAAGLVNGDNASVVTGTLTRESGENVGVYQIQGDNLTAENYEINFVSADFTITKAPLTVTADAKTKVYGHADPELTYSVEAAELVNGDNASVVTGTLTRDSGENVGFYQIHGDNLTAENYEINFESADFTITKAALTVTADPKTKVYGQADPALTYSVDAAELVNGDDASVVTGTLTRESGENVGVYQIQGDNLTADNYEINFESADFTITKAALTVTADAKTKVYGQADSELSFSVDAAGLVNGDNASVVTGTLTRESGENVGVYQIQGDNLTADNYEINFVSADFTITKAALTVTADAKTKVYGQADPALTYTVEATGLVNGDNASVVTGTLTRESGENVGVYQIQGDNLTADNYEINFVSADFTITKAALTVTADAKTKVYGHADPELTYSVEAAGLVNGDNASVVIGTLTRESGENVGVYQIQGDNLTADNYEINFVSADFTITKAALTVTADAKTKVYGQADPELSFSVDAARLVNGDDASVVTGTLTRESGENVGVYQIQGDNLTAENYEINFVSADFTITKAPLSNIVFASKSFIFDNSEHKLEIESTLLPAGTQVRYENNNRTEVGSQLVTAIIYGPNYEELRLTATLTVTPATRTLTFDAIPIKTYGDPDFELFATINTNEIIVFTSSNPQVAQITNGKVKILSAGTTQITATVESNANFDNQPSITRELVVNKASQTITANAPSEVKRNAGTISLNVSSSSGLPVEIQVSDPLIATVTGTNLLIHRLGTVSIQIAQPGNENYHPATPVHLTLRVIPEEDHLENELPIKVNQALSPNGDGLNDKLIIEGINDYPDNKVTIFDKNGKVIWEGRGYNNGTVAFNGLGKSGVQLPLGTYFYLIEVRDGNVWKTKKSFFVIRY